MGSTRKGMLNVLIAAVLWGSSGVCAQYIMEQSQMSSQFLTMTRLIFAGLILLTLSFVHGDKIFSIINNHKDAISLLIFSVVGHGQPRTYRNSPLPAAGCPPGPFP